MKRLGFLSIWLMSIVLMSGCWCHPHHFHPDVKDADPQDVTTEEMAEIHDCTPPEDVQDIQDVPVTDSQPDVVDIVDVQPTQYALLLGDSNISANPYVTPALPGVDLYMTVPTFNYGHYGASIQSEKYWYETSEYHTNPNPQIRWVVLQVGLNNVFEPNFTFQQNVDWYQSFVNLIHADYPNAILIVSQMTPARLRMEIVEATYPELPQYAVANLLPRWLALNEAIAGQGPSPIQINPSDARITNVEMVLGNMNHYLVYDVGDGIHTSVMGRQLNAGLFNDVISTHP